MNSSVRHISITQAESKRVAAIMAHLRQIVSTPLTPTGSLLRPVEIDHGLLLLSSASFRALLFDDSPSPILLDFTKQHDIKVEVETFETNLSMLLLAQVAPSGDSHVSDYFAQLLYDSDLQKQFEPGHEKQVFLATERCPTYDDAAKRPDVWGLSDDEDKKINSYLGYSNLGGPAQLCTITRKIVPLDEWGDVRVGYLRNIAIRRRNIICYVANKLGGVHFDSSRLPRNNRDKAAFNVLAQAYDWDKQAVMHAGLVAVALACLEMLRAPIIRSLLAKLDEFHQKRQERLRKGELLE